MNGGTAARWKVLVKSPGSRRTVMVLVTLLSAMFRNDPALASDGFPAPSFASPRIFSAAPGRSISVTAGDLNHDGQADLAVGHLHPFDCCDVNVSVLLGKGDGTFAPATNHYAGMNPVALAVGDFSGDGNSDLITGNANYTDVFSVLLGNGDGTFGTAVGFGAGWTPETLVAGDFNHDGKLDLAAACSVYFTGNGSDYTNGSALVLLGNGDGTFQPPRQLQCGVEPVSVAVGDFNADGLSDLAVANHGSTNVSVLLGQGDGRFLNAVNYRAGVNPWSVAAADFNRDGKADLAVANTGTYYQDSFTNSSVSVLLGNGDGTFQSAVNYAAGAAPVSVAVADFNGDGRPDLAVVNYWSTNVSILLGQGDGTFQSAVNFSTEQEPQYYPQSLALGDFNGDGRPDLAVVVGNGVSVLLNTCPKAGVKLAIARATSALTLSWPLPYTNFVLESAANLSPTNWHRLLESPKTDNGRCEVTLPFAEEQRYFRLRTP
jgi:uncharacterized protein (UPF0548 family)